MTASELVEAVESVGGTLAVKGDKLRCAVPREAAHLIPALQTQKPAVIELLKQRIAALPWPGYNGGKQFRCDLCGAHFDTSAGYAKHHVYGCDASKATEATEARPLPRCATCGSYALYREKDGAVTCRTCELREL